jgi:hypothetical protein
VAARPLQHVRDLVGADLVRQVNRISAELNAETDSTVRASPQQDRALLRGVPFTGTRGVITDQPVPGDDEHLERLSAA